jgi:Rrf2 family protein
LLVEVLAMIPKTVEYALRAVVVLARDPERAYSAEQIAETTRVPRRYAHKVLQALVRAGLVRSQSGPGGGYALVRAPDEVSILDVVNAVEPISRIRRCPLGLTSHVDLCPLHRELDQACAATERAFARVTIAQLLNPSSTVPPLCEVARDGKDQSQKGGRRHERPNGTSNLRARSRPAR